MLKSLDLWKGIFTNPLEGFKSINNETKIAFPIVLILFLSIITGILLLPILTNDAYADNMVRLIEKSTESSGNQMTTEQRQQMEKYMKSDTGKIISSIQSAVGFPINTAIAIFLGGLVLMILGKIFRGEIDYGKSIRIMIFSSIVIVLGLLIKTGLAVASDWRSALSSTESVYDLNSVFMTNISAAVFFNSSSIGRIPYFIVNYITDVFNLGCAFFVISGLRAICKMTTGKAAASTAILFALPFLITLISMLAFHA